MTRNAIFSTLILMILLLMSSIPRDLAIESAPQVQRDDVSARSSGVDIRPTAFSFEYTNNVDFESYGLLSSHTCCETVNRPASLWIVDGMLNVDQTISVTVENSGANNSGQFEVRIYVLHDEYPDFLLLDISTTIMDLGSGSSTTIQVSWLPDYSGNHTIHAVALHPADDDPSDDDLSRHYTIGTSYENANAAGIWNPVGNWNLDSDTGISPHDFASSLSGYRTSFYIGNQATTSYGNNWVDDMLTTNLDYSDRLLNPSQNYLISFLWTGSSQPGDVLYLHVENSNGWKRLATISTQLDPTATNWQLYTVSVSPSDLHSATRFRFQFISNSVDTDAGYWLDDIVVVYDQRARDGEYDPGLTAPTPGGAAVGEWSNQNFTLANLGKLEDRIALEMPDLPTEWDWRVTYRDAGPVDPVSGLQVEREGTRSLTLHIMPGPNATVGQYNFSFEARSLNAPTSARSTNVAFEVHPTYRPLFTRLEDDPTCRPGSNCGFLIELTNAGDAVDTFEISATLILLRVNWTLGLAWDQTADVELQPDESTFISFLLDVPSVAIPGQFSSILLVATSTQRPDISDLYRINATAGMISDAWFAVELDSVPAELLNPSPGTMAQIPFTLWNNASTYDLFSICIEVRGARTWVVQSEHAGLLTTEGSTCAAPFEIEVPAFSDLQISVSLLVPGNAQAGDRGPLLVPFVNSTRSGDAIYAIPFQDLSVRMVHDIELVSLSSPLYLSPGGESEFTFIITNHGNGEESVNFTISGLEPGWTYWFEQDGLEGSLSLPLILSPAYEGLQTAYLSLVLGIPIDVDGGEVVEFTLTAISTSGEIDVSPADTAFDYSGWTAMVFEPVWVVAPPVMIQASADSFIMLEGTLTNSGNAFDSQMQMKFDIETSTGLNGVLAYLIIGEDSETYLQSGEWVTIPLDRNAEVDVKILLTLPADAPIPSELSIRWLVEGGANQLGDYSVLDDMTQVEVSIFRHVEAEISLESGTMPAETTIFFRVDITSRSTIIEDLTLESGIPEGWDLKCDDDEGDGPFHQILPAAVTFSTREATMWCNIRIPHDPGRHSLNFSVVDLDGELIESWEIEYIVQSTRAAGFFAFMGASSTMLWVILTLAGMITLLLLVLALQRREEEYLEDEEDEQHPSASTYADQQTPLAVAQPAGTHPTSGQQLAHQVKTDPTLGQGTFTQPTTAPPGQQNVAEPLNLEDAFGSLMPAADEDKQDEQQAE